MCALVALAFTSCKKTNTNSTMTFKASITQPESNDRTWVTQRSNLAWSMGDTILVFDANTVNKDFTVSSLNGTGNDLDQEAIFVVEDEKVGFLADIETPKTYSAFYPHASFNAGDNTVSMTIPATQKWDFENGHGGSFTTNTYPMFGVNDAANHFEFRSHAGILQFNFACETDRIVRVKEIIITADDPLVGTMVYNYKYPVDSVYSPTADVYTVTETANTVNLECFDSNNDYVELSQPDEYGTLLHKRFEFALLRGALANGFHVTVIGDKNNPSNFAEMMYNQTLLDEDVPASIDNQNVNNTIEAEKITNMMNRFLPAYGPGEGDGFVH